MRRLLLLLVASLALTAAAPAVTATVTVVISRAGLVPANVTIKQGDTVMLDTRKHRALLAGG